MRFIDSIVRMLLHEDRSLQELKPEVINLLRFLNAKGEEFARTTKNGLPPDEFVADFDVKLHGQNWIRIRRKTMGEDFPFCFIDSSGQIYKSASYRMDVVSPLKAKAHLSAPETWKNLPAITSWWGVA